MAEPRVLVEGYVLCPRGRHSEPELVRKEVAQRLGGVCSACFAAEGGKLITSVEVVTREGRIRLPSRRPDRRNRYRPQRNARKDLNKKARQRAARRVAAMFPNLYDVVLAEEREALGLPPWPVDIAARGLDATAEIVHAARQAGVL